MINKINLSPVSGLGGCWFLREYSLSYSYFIACGGFVLFFLFCCAVLFSFLVSQSSGMGREGSLFYVYCLRNAVCLSLFFASSLWCPCNLRYVIFWS